MRLSSVDLGRAGFALALAIVLYFVAVSETNPETRSRTSFAVPVEVVNVPSGLVPTERPPGVNLLVRATPSVFSRLRADSFSAQVDASTAHAGENDLPVMVRPTDPDVRSADAEPSLVRLNFEEVQERVLPVRVNLTGQVPSGYTLGQARADPDRVTVAGAASLVGRAAEAIVDAGIDRVTVSVNGAYTPRVVDVRGNDLRDLNLRLNPPSVTVQIPITQQTQYKEVGIHPVTQGQLAPGYALQPLEVNPPVATLVGDPAALDSVNFVDTQPIDISGISTTVVRTVPLAPPARTLLLQQGQQAIVTIRVQTLTIAQTVRVPPSVINLSSNVVLARLPDPIAVTITGPAPTLSTLNSNDFRVVVDVGGRGPGRYEVAPRVQNLPGGMTLESIDPKQVQVDLREAPPPPTPTPGG
ncbi:MAG TPA: CdaR family protein [Chloroflexota bacterium]|jgi:YbbR domain-containing protein|nr:CdaR family protein [Chloroflexota bacterium]